MSSSPFSVHRIQTIFPILRLLSQFFQSLALLFSNLCDEPVPEHGVKMKWLVRISNRNNNGEEEVLPAETLPGTIITSEMYALQWRRTSCWDIMMCNLAKLVSTIVVLKQKNKMNMVRLNLEIFFMG